MQQNIKQIVDTVTSWEDVTSAPHRFGGIEFQIGNIEVGHIHSNGMVDIPFTRKIREQLVTDGKAEHHHLLDDSGWITFYIRDDANVRQAIWLYRLSYLQKRRTSNRHDDALRLQIREEVATMDAGPVLTALFN